jgi:hypothetical protein
MDKKTFNINHQLRPRRLYRHRYLKSRLQLLQRVAQRIIAPCNPAAHLVDIRLRGSLCLDGRVVVESRRFHDFLIRQLVVAFAIRSLVHVDDHGASKPQVVLQSHVAVDETVVGPSAQLPGEFGALRQTCCAERVALVRSDVSNASNDMKTQGSKLTLLIRPPEGLTTGPLPP